MEADIHRRFEMVGSTLDERQRRLWAASEAKAAGVAGVTLAHRATGLVSASREGEAYWV